MMTEIQKWLSNPKRKYADGLNYFNRFASKKQKESFGAFLNDVDNDTVHQFGGSGQFPILINQVVFVLQRIKTNPDLYKESRVKPKPVKIHEPAITPEAVPMNNIPDDFDTEKKRLKEIVPLMAKIHAEMANETLPDDKRHNIVKELIELDDERRAIWNKIDSAGIEVEKLEEEKAVETNMVAMGASIQNRITQLKGYITRNQNSVKNHTAKGKTKLAKEAQKRLDAYRQELDQLNQLVSADGK